jgi:predicted nucleic acid-binding protein
VIVLDANILVYVYNSDAREHGVVAARFERLAAEGTSIGLPLPAVWAFLRICTNPRAVLHPLSGEQAFGIIRNLLSLHCVSLIQPVRDTWRFWKS